MVLLSMVLGLNELDHSNIHECLVRLVLIALTCTRLHSVHPHDNLKLFQVSNVVGDA